MDKLTQRLSSVARLLRQSSSRMEDIIDRLDDLNGSLVEAGSLFEGEMPPDDLSQTTEEIYDEIEQRIARMNRAKAGQTDPPTLRTAEGSIPLRYYEGVSVQCVANGAATRTAHLTVDNLHPGEKVLIHVVPVDTESDETS